jgi:hypothetical protein
MVEFYPIWVGGITGIIGYMFAVYGNNKQSRIFGIVMLLTFMYSVYYIIMARTA